MSVHYDYSAHFAEEKTVAQDKWKWSCWDWKPGGLLTESQLLISPLYGFLSKPFVWGFHIRGIQPTLDQKYSEKNSRKIQKANLNLLYAGNYLHNVHIVFTTNYTAFTLC